MRNFTFNFAIFCRTKLEKDREMTPPVVNYENRSAPPPPSGVPPFMVAYPVGSIPLGKFNH